MESMLTFYYGNQLEPLADRLINLYSDQPLKDPLAREIVVVQNHGMARWLSTRMARKCGIAANYKFEFPAERLWALYRCMDADIPKELPSDREPMTWTLYQLLSEIPNKSPYLSVWNYLHGDQGNISPLKTRKLANRVGGLFDKYLIYRPGMLRKWQEGDTKGLGAAEAWQAELWRKLNEIWNESFAGIKWKHQAEIHKAFMEEVEARGIPPDGLPERITLFGLSGLPPASIEAFIVISEVVDVHWFWRNPTVGDLFGTLRDSWGSEGEQFLEIFEEKARKRGISPQNIPVSIEGSGSTGPPDNKTNILDLFEQNEDQEIEIQVHSCHSPLREVEVLYDNLLNIFEQNPNLEPEDVTILCPDISTYAPFIEAVFGTPEKELPRLPYHIVDDQTGARKAVYGVFSKLLEILDSRFKVTEVLDLLSSDVIRVRYDISEDELERLQAWIRDTKVRWGISAEDKRRMDLPGNSQFTWVAALNRMMLGFAAQMEEQVFKGIYPYDQIESSENADMLGKLSRFLNNLSKARENVHKPRSLEEWGKILEKWIEAFIPADSDYYRAYQSLNSLISNMVQAAELGEFHQRIGYAVLFDYLENKLTGEATRGGYFGHGITFSGLEQMRNIPSRIIGMVGMNNEAFPGTKITPDFDLMAQSPEPGDRSQRDDDRYLFLETLQSVKQVLYLSYVGQSNRDDSSRPPSVLISELLDYLSDKEDKRVEDIVIKHPLQAFGSSYFDSEEKQLFTYSSTSHEVFKQLTSADSREETLFFPNSLPEADESYRVIMIDDLVRFYVHPARFLVQQRLGIYFREEEVISEDREPFQLGGLEEYKLAEKLLERRLNNKQVDNFEPIAEAVGMLPAGWPGRQEFRDKVEEISEFSEELIKLFEMDKMERTEVSLDFDEFHLTGTLNSLYSEYQLFTRYGKIRPKDLINLWIHHLVLQQVPDIDHSKRSLLIGKEGTQPVYSLLTPVENSAEYLNFLIDLYWRGIHQKIPLFTESSFAFARELLLKEQDENKALDKARSKWYNSWSPEWSEREDPYIKLLFKNEEPIGSQEFNRISLELWKPVLKILEEDQV